MNSHNRCALAPVDMLTIMSDHRPIRVEQCPHHYRNRYWLR